MTTRSIDAVDHEALERAIAIKLRQGGAEALQIRHMLKSDGWEETGKSAAYGCQVRALQLRPWQTPPQWVEVDDVDAVGDEQRGVSAAAKLLRQLFARGLSRHEPDPLNALAAAEAAEASG